MPSVPPRHRLLPAVLMLALGVIGFTAVWVTLALKTGRQLSWLALLAAIDMALLLAVMKLAASPLRAALAVAGTAAKVALANFMIVAGQVGIGMGMQPWTSALLLGRQHAWTLADLANTPRDWGTYLGALVLAAWAGLSARRRAP